MIPTFTRNEVLLTFVLLLALRDESSHQPPDNSNLKFNDSMNVKVKHYKMNKKKKRHLFTCFNINLNLEFEGWDISLVV